MSRRLAMKRLRRSDSSMMVPKRARPCRLRRAHSRGRAASRPTRGSRRDGVFRSCEIEVSREARSRSVSASSLARSTSSARPTRSIASAPWSVRASSSRRCSGVSSAPGFSESSPTTRDGAAPGAHRHEQAAGAGQRIGTASGGAIVGPRPLRGGEIGGIERVLGRVAGLQLEASVLRHAAGRR